MAAASLLFYTPNVFMHRDINFHGGRKEERKVLSRMPKTFRWQSARTTEYRLGGFSGLRSLVKGENDTRLSMSSVVFLRR